jgi:phosphatidate cytidylyltransferase
MCAALPLQYFFVARGALLPYTLFIPAFALLAVPAAAARLCEPADVGERSATMQCGLVLCVWCISHVPALLALEIPGYEGRDAFLLVFFILVVQASDVLQYVWGKFAGRRPIAPRLSPSKTVEGFVGGIGCATALGALLAPITPFSVAEAAILSFVITVLGFTGGLMMSALKRKRGIKDWGTLIRGHGGMLDRLDSVCLSAPVFLHVVRIGWAG